MLGREQEAGALPGQTERSAGSRSSVERTEPRGWTCDPAEHTCTRGGGVGGWRHAEPPATDLILQMKDRREPMHMRMDDCCPSFFTVPVFRSRMRPRGEDATSEGRGHGHQPLPWWGHGHREPPTLRMPCDGPGTRVFVSSRPCNTKHLILVRTAHENTGVSDVSPPPWPTRSPCSSRLP